MLGDHIYNISAIVSKIKTNANIGNLYEKVNQLLKGANIKNDSLRAEVFAIIEDEFREYSKHLGIDLNLQNS